MGSPPPGLIDALVADATTRFGASAPSDLRARITDLVNGTLPRMGMGPRGGHGHWGGGIPAAAGAAKLGPVARPGGEQAAVVRDELLVLVWRERRADGVDEHAVELGALEPGVGRFVEMAERPRAELGVRVRLEVLVGERAVRA